MTLYIKLEQHWHDGIGPGFPDRLVNDGFKVSLEPKPGFDSVEVPGITTTKELSKLALFVRQLQVDDARDEAARAIENWVRQLDGPPKTCPF